MKFLILLLISFNAMAVTCEKVPMRKYLALKEELIVEHGYGLRKAEDILDARTAICQGRCGHMIDSAFYVCLAKAKIRGSRNGE